VTARVVAVLLDTAVVLVFATLGRATHAEGVTAGGVASVAWPFLLAAAVGWAAARGRAGWPVSLPAGVVVWLVTVVGGLALRVLTGGGFAVSFGVVTLLVLGGGMVGWRVAWAVARRGRLSTRRAEAARDR